MLTPLNKIGRTWEDYPYYPYHYDSKIAVIIYNLELCNIIG